VTVVPAAFELDLLPIRAIFGGGESTKLPLYLEHLGIKRPLLVGTPAAQARYRGAFEALADLQAATFFGAQPHCPEAVADRCAEVYAESGCDGVVAIGGGSSLGLGKILAAEHAAKFVALPTTFSGSEMTPLFGKKVGTEKRVRKDARCRPALVLYDPQLVASLPLHVAAASGMNSVAHAVEALYPQRPNPLAPVLAEQALAAHHVGLRAFARGNPTRSELQAAQYGGFLGGVLVSMCGIALHHQLCHIIGGLFDLPHRETNSAVLPHALAYNAPAIADALVVLRRVFGSDDAPRAVFDFAQEIGAAQSLRDLGMPESGIDVTVDTMLAHGGWNPRPLERSGLERMVRNAFEGRRP